MNKVKRSFLKRIIDDPFHLNLRPEYEAYNNKPKDVKVQETMLSVVFTAFHLHPCLLLKLAEDPNILNRRTGLTSQEFTRFVQQIHGDCSFNSRKE
jgi:hypothetical protein